MDGWVPEGRGTPRRTQDATRLDDVAERPAPQAVELQGELRLVSVPHNEDVALFPDANLSPDLGDGAALQERPEGEKIVARRRQPKAVVHALLVHDEDVPEELADDLVSAAAADVCDRRDELEGDKLVVPHAHLDGDEDTEVIAGHVPEALDVELHRARKTSRRARRVASNSRPAQPRVL